MEEKNKKMIIIVTSLLLVVGVSLAYFTASVLLGGDGTSVTGTTTTIQDSTLIVEGTLEFNDLDIYPGHESVSSIRVTATGNNELIPYNVIWKGTNTLNTPLNYTVYKTSSSIDVNTSCENKTGIVDGAKIYYEECTITNLESLGSPITEGTITTSEGETTIELIGDEFITSTNDGISVYYYVILEYPNLDESQNIDIGGSFSGEVTIEESDAQPDLNLVAVMIEDGYDSANYNYSEQTPSNPSIYNINQERTTCQINGVEQDDITITYNRNTGKLTFDGVNKSRTLCTVYLDRLYRDANAAELILSTSKMGTGTPDFSKTSCSSGCGEATVGLYKEKIATYDKTYYFRGDVNDNWVQFAGFYWRIIRINEDGSIRMIYSGDSESGPATVGEDTQIGTSAFSEENRRNEMVGYMYAENQVHGLTTDSIIKGMIDQWYEDNLQVNYEKYLSTEAGFCGDRTNYTNVDGTIVGGGTGTTVTYYGAYIRLITNKTPTFECPDERDLYTIKEAVQGNNALNYPIGLITADEVAFAGGVFDGASNRGYYLYTAQHYRTITPINHASGSLSNGTVGLVYESGTNNGVSTPSAYGVRPVINLRSDVVLSGLGTSTDPYRVVEL